MPLMDPTASRHPTAPNCRKRPWDDTDNQAETVDADGLPVASTSQWTAAQVDPTAALAKRLKTTALALPDQELVPFTQ
ncbi:hypothetical protein H4R35_005242 [Dimargaris xerosporica]|nr:hypothetical protein H4R35_005242 [Dimargaris xerosporica]